MPVAQIVDPRTTPPRTRFEAPPSPAVAPVVPSSESLGLARPLPRFALGMACLALAVWCADAFFETSWAYLDFWHPAAAAARIPALELSFDLLYLAYGLCFLSLIVAAVELTGRAPALVSGLGRLARWRFLPALLIGIVAAGALAARFQIVQRQAVTDDEEVYLFIARTLLDGRLTNVPEIEPEFLSNQFVVLGTEGWFGKYPIGHGLVLALALLTRSLDLLVPLLGGVTAALTWFVARRLVGRRRAVLALALLALSPHFVWTHATLLSQTTSALAVMAAMACLVSCLRRPRAGALIGAGAALAFGLLTRPVPTAFLVPVFGLAVYLRDRGRPGLRSLALFASPILIGIAAIALVNRVQSGSVLLSGYHLADGSLGLFSGKPGAIGLSLLGAAVRENFWLFGWPLSLLPVALARPRRAPLLLWGPVLAALVYRIVIPKTGVATTGPTYLLEAVPVLAILAADGLARAHAFARRVAGRRGSTRVAVAAVAAAVTALVFFLPVHARSIHHGTSIRGRVFQMLADRGIDRAVVFANLLVQPRSGVSYAYFPPNPSPSLDDDLLFLRLPSGREGRARAIEVWQRHFADRPAFLFQPPPRTSLRRLRPATGGSAPSEPRPSRRGADVPDGRRLP